MHATILRVLSGLLAAAAVAPAAAPTGEPARAFAVLRTRCLACHDRKLHSGRLVLETQPELLAGGAHGAAIVPGRSAESLLMKRVTGAVPPRMPLEGELTPEEVATLGRWIDAGAAPWAESPDSAPLAVPEIKPSVPVAAPVHALAYSPDGRLLAVAGYREVRLLDAATRQPLRVLAGATDAVRGVAFSPDGGLVAGSGGSPARYGEVVLWEPVSGRVVRTLRGHRDYVYAAAFSPDGRRLATSSYDRLIKLWDVASGTELRTLKEHTDAVFPIAFSPDGARLASGGADRTVKLWDVESGRRLLTLGDSTDAVGALAFDPAGRRLSAGGADKQIRTWRLEGDAATLERSVIAHEAEITRLLYFPEGLRLASASADRAVKIWDARTGELVRALPGQSDWVLGLAVRPDGKALAVGRYDGSLECYPAAPGPPDAARAERGR